MMSYIHTNLPVNAIVGLSHPQNGNSQAQEMFLALSADNRTCNYDIECSFLYMYNKCTTAKKIGYTKVLIPVKMKKIPIQTQVNKMEP